MEAQTERNGNARPPKVLMHIECLRGTGELTMAAEVAQAMADKGIEVTVVSGNTGEFFKPHARITRRELKKISYDDRLTKTYQAEGGKPLSESGEWCRARARAVRDIVDQVQPDAVLICYWPFGNGRDPENNSILDHELEPLVKHLRETRPDVPIFGSIREIIHADSKPYNGEGKHAADLMNRHYTRVFVAGSDLVDETDYKKLLRPDLLQFTGLICDPAPPDAATTAKDTIVISPGGGDFRPSSGPIYEKSLAALPNIDRGFLEGKTVRVLVGKRFKDEEVGRIEGLAQQARTALGEKHIHAEIRVERTKSREDYQELLKHCALFIGQAGIGSVTDIIRFHYPAVTIPIDEKGPNGGYHFQEQSIRAGIMDAKNVLRQLSEDELKQADGAHLLAQRIDAALHVPQARWEEIGINGAENTAAAILAEIEKNRARSAPGSAGGSLAGRHLRRPQQAAFRA